MSYPKWAAPSPGQSSARVIDLSLMDEALRHPGVEHSYLADLAAGRLPDMRWALADFARQYRGYSAAFPQFLTAVISRLERQQDRATLMENLAEESGHYEPEVLATLRSMGVEDGWIVGVRHPVLFDQFCLAVGVDPAEIPATEAIEAVCWREQFLSLVLSGSPAEAVGALGFGTEAVVPMLYRALLDACRHVPSLTAKDTVFFLLHTEVDDGHNEALAAIANGLAVTDQDRIDVVKGMHKALALRSGFWTWLHRRALAVEPADIALNQGAL